MMDKGWLVIDDLLIQIRIPFRVLFCKCIRHYV